VNPDKLRLPRKRSVAVGRANAEELDRFPTESFDCYIANMTLMLVGSPGRQIKEAHRVLKKGGKAGFAIWGRK
jgi:ubiquinone/menaquinone biosynthesis C-methylase UbiE